MVPRRRRTRSPAFFVLALLWSVSGCGAPARSLPVASPQVELWCCTAGDEGISIQYLGVGGWLFRMGEASILTAPFFSNPGLVEVGLGRIEADTARIDRYLPPVADVDAVLVGHAHYDHLMDIPYILRRRAPEARLYGSRTAVNLLSGDPALDRERLVSVEAVAGDAATPGEWWYTSGGRIRFMALLSEHAPHFLGIHLYEGQVEAPADALPERAGGWVEGTPLAYLIDFLSPEGEVIYRVHYQDAASAPPMGFPPPPADGVGVDLAILCPPGSEEVDGYPEGILARLDPGAVLLGHWEDFFRPRSDPLVAVPGTDLAGFIRRMTDALPADRPWGLLEPGGVVRIQSGGR